MSEILIISPEQTLASAIQEELAQEDFAFAVVHDEPQLGTFLEGARPGLAIIDLVTSEATGQACLAVVRQHHQDGKEIPLLGLLSRSEMAPAEAMLDLKDFIFLPYDAHELQTRVQVLLWRSEGIQRPDVIRLEDLVIDTAQYEVYLAGSPVDLTYKEYELLRFLATNRDRVFTREQLLNRVWGYDYFGGTRTVDVHIRRLRSKIEDATHTYIETVRNVGYRLTLGRAP